MTDRVDTTQRLANDRVGKVVDNKYLLRSVIGIGGMGIVYEAEHQFLGRLVALKILHPRYIDRFEEFQRFLREARAVGAIGHSSIVEVFDAGCVDGTTPYLVMERLFGGNLDERIRRRGPMSVRRAFRVAHDILRGLAAAHSKRVLHLDMKPANVFLVRSAGHRSTVKLLDFGISRMNVEGSVPAVDSPKGFVFGTPHYMAPEQVTAGPVDVRTDLYAVGAILFEALTGKPPYRGDSRREVFTAILNEPLPRIGQTRGDLTKPLARIVYSLLSRRPEDRPSSAQQVIETIVESGVLQHDAAR